MSVGALITWPYKAGGRSRRGSPKAGTTVIGFTMNSDSFSPKLPTTQVCLTQLPFCYTYFGLKLFLDTECQIVHEMVRGQLGAGWSDLIAFNIPVALFSE